MLEGKVGSQATGGRSRGWVEGRRVRGRGDHHRLEEDRKG